MDLLQKLAALLGLSTKELKDLLRGPVIQGFFQELDAKCLTPARNKAGAANTTRPRMVDLATGDETHTPPGSDGAIPQLETHQPKKHPFKHAHSFPASKDQVFTSVHRDPCQKK